MKEVNNMARKTDPSLKNENGVYTSRQKANKNWEDTKVEQLTVRFPKGSRDKLKEYVEQKSKSEPDNPKYSSLNALIKHLLVEETGITLD